MRLAASVSLVVGLAALPATARAATCNWLTAAANWATGGNWSCGMAPTPADDAVVTTSGVVVSVSGINANAGTLNLGAGNRLNVTGGSTFGLYNGGMTNNGLITVASNSFGAPLTVGGTGTIVLDNSAAAARLFGGIWSFGGGATVRGAGQVGANQTICCNAGLVSADVSGRVLSIDVIAGLGGVGAGNGVGTNGNAGSKTRARCRRP